MKVLIVNSEITIEAEGFNAFWQSFKSSNDEDCMMLESKQDLERLNIDFFEADIEIKQEEI